MDNKAERRKVWKWWWVWDFEKEEQWLNDMAMSGWVLEKVGFAVYTFVHMPENDYTVRFSMRADDVVYESIMADMGAEYIGRVVGWVYYRCRASVAEFSAPDDIDTRIEHLQSIAKLLLILGGANICIGVANSLNSSTLGWINLLCGCLLMYALGRIRGKQDELKKERVVHE